MDLLENLGMLEESKYSVKVFLVFVGNISSINRTI